MYTGSPSIKKSKPTTGFLVRPRLGASRSLLSPTSQDKKRNKTKKPTSGSAKMDFRKKPDYADNAYREAVSRLRILLAESYTTTPIERSFRGAADLDSAGEDTDNQSCVSANSRNSRLGTRSYYHYLTMFPRRHHYHPSSTTTTIKNFPATDKGKGFLDADKSNQSAAPPELMSFIEKQEDYIEQLEKESRFCKEELSSLLSKVKDVISENENLHEKQKHNLMRSVFHHLETETETETELDQNQKLLLSPQKSKKIKNLEGPKIMFESRISELEAQLTQAKIDLKKALEENEALKKKNSESGALDNLNFDAYKKQLENCQREKEDLQSTVAKLQAALAKIRDKENDTCDQVKRSLDVAEQAQYEKNAAELEIRRLKDELDRQHAKLRDAISDQSRRITDERGAVERRYTQQIEQLTTELGVQWETSNKLQLELDKYRRENTDLRREIAQKQALLDDMKKDMQNKIMSLQSDIGVTGAEKGALEQQIATLQMLNERSERQSKQEIARLQAEMQSLRQRLDRADADLIHSRRENIRLTEQIASLEKEIRINKALSDERKSKQDEILALPSPKKEHREKELTSLIDDMESKHAATVAELEGMIHSQNQLMDKLSTECHTLTQKLEEASNRHKEEIRELQTSLDRLNNRFSQSQIRPASVKDEEYNPGSYERSSAQQPTQGSAELNHNPTNQQQNQLRNLSRTNSRTSVKPSPSSSNSQQDTNQTKNTSLPHRPQQQQQQQQQQQAYQQDPISSAPVDAQLYHADENYQQYPISSNNHNVNDNNSVSNINDTDQSQITDSSQPLMYDPNDQQQYVAATEADPDTQQYMTEEEYQQQQYDMNQQYFPDQQQYAMDPNQQYSGESDPANHQQQYVEDPNQQYAVVDPNQQYPSAETDQQYVASEAAIEQQYTEEVDPQQQQYSTETGK